MHHQISQEEWQSKMKEKKRQNLTDPRLPANVQRPFPYRRMGVEHPSISQMSDVLHGLFARTRIPWLVASYKRVPILVLALFAFINGCVSIGLMSMLALVTGSPFIFPSLGPTAFLFFYKPLAPSASPRNTLVGHALGATVGYLSLLVTGLASAAPALSMGVTWSRVLAASLSLGLTSGLMILLKSPHPPAGATTLIVSLGILARPWQLGLLMIAVVLLTLHALVINRLAGIPYPLWNPVRGPSRNDPAEPASSDSQV
ncbi:MAG TPA: HPP family protein [Ktedonobacteraceae bacterium]|nr:HPP family protein [Ktedonobacteraceae bacterium]